MQGVFNKKYGVNAGRWEIEEKPHSDIQLIANCVILDSLLQGRYSEMKDVYCLSPQGFSIIIKLEDGTVIKANTEDETHSGEEIKGITIEKDGKKATVDFNAISMGDEQYELTNINDLEVENVVYTGDVELVTQLQQAMQEQFISQQKRNDDKKIADTQNEEEREESWEELLKKEVAQEQKKLSRIEMAKREGLPLEIIEELAKDDSVVVRDEVARREDLPLEIIKELAQDKNCIIRAVVAGREDLPLEIIKELAQDEDSFVRDQVAGREDLPLEIIKELAQDEDSFVRDRVAIREDLPLESLEELLQGISLDKLETRKKQLETRKKQLETTKKQLETTNTEKNEDLQQLRKKTMIKEIRGLIEQNNQLEQQITELREAQKDETSK